MCNGGGNAGWRSGCSGLILNSAQSQQSLTGSPILSFNLKSILLFVNNVGHSKDMGNLTRRV